MFELLRIMLICGTILIVTFLVLLSLPKSRLRCFLLEIVGWAMAALSAIYVVSPIDLIPDFIPVLGQVDDVGALIGGAAAAIAAIGARADRNRLEDEE